MQFLAVFAALAALFAIGQFHRSAGGVLGTTLAADFGLGAEAIGIAMGAMFLAQGVAQLPAGLLLDRFGPRLIIPLVTLLAAAGCIVLALASDATTVLLGRILIGIGFSATLMGSVVLLGRWSGPGQHSTITGRFLFIGMMGGLFATTPLVLLLAAVGWQAVFLGLTAVTVAVAALGWAVLRDWPPDRGAPPSPPPSGGLGLGGVWEVLRSRRFLPFLLVGSLLYCTPQVLLGLWAAPYLREVHGLDAVWTGHALMTMAVAMGLGALVFGPIERRSRGGGGVVCAGALTVAAAFAGLALLGGDAPLVATALCLVAILGSGYFVVTLAQAQALFPPELSGRVVSLVGTLGVVGIFAVQALTALVLARFPDAGGALARPEGYSAVFGLMAALQAFVALVWFVGGRGGQPPRAGSAG